jgi:mitochondrial fission protein ELM1
MLSFLGAAHKILVTADSMSMVSECISSGRAVSIISPEIAKPNSRYINAMNKLTIGAGINMITLSEMMDISIHNVETNNLVNKTRSFAIGRLLQLTNLNCKNKDLDGN